MDTSSSIRQRFDVEISHGKFVEMTSIESTWKLWHRFDVEISTWIRLSKSTKYRWVLHVDFLTLFLRRIEVTSVLAVFIVLFRNIFCSGTYSILFWYSAETMWFQQYWRNHWCWNYWSYMLSVMTLLNRSKDNLYLLQNNTDKDCNANVYK